MPFNDKEREDVNTQILEQHLYQTGSYPQGPVLPLRPDMRLMGMEMRPHLPTAMPLLPPTRLVPPVSPDRRRRLVHLIATERRELADNAVQNFRATDLYNRTVMTDRVTGAGITFFSPT